MNKLTYTKSGNYYIPDLTLEEQPDTPIGKYGRMRQRYLKGTLFTSFIDLVFIIFLT